MATTASAEPSLDIREQIARIDRMQAELSRTQAEINRWQVEAAQSHAQTAKLEVETAQARAQTVKLERETRLAPWALAFTGLGAGAGLFAAGAAFAKLLLG